MSWYGLAGCFVFAWIFIVILFGFWKHMEDSEQMPHSVASWIGAIFVAIVIPIVIMVLGDSMNVGKQELLQYLSKPRRPWL